LLALLGGATIVFVSRLRVKNRIPPPFPAGVKDIFLSFSMDTQIFPSAQISRDLRPITHLYLMVRLKVSGAVNLLPHTPSRRAQ